MTAEYWRQEKNKKAAKESRFIELYRFSNVFQLKILCCLATTTKNIQATQLLSKYLGKGWLFHFSFWKQMDKLWLSILSIPQALILAILIRSTNLKVFRITWIKYHTGF